MDDLNAFDALWDFGDPAGTEARFRALLDDPRMTPALALEVQTQIARTLGLRRRFAEARALLDGLVPRFEGDSARVRTRWLLEAGRTYASAIHADDKPTAQALYLGAWSLARAHGEDRLAVDAAHMLAIVAPTPEAQDAWHASALALAEGSPDPAARRWRASLLNNIGMAHHEAGRHAQALAAFQAALAARLADGANAQTVQIARWMVAWELRFNGAHEQALAMLRELDAEHSAQGSADGFVFEEIGENLLALGRGAEAQPWFARAWQLLQDDPEVAGDAARRERLRGLAQAPASERKP